MEMSGRVRMQIGAFLLFALAFSGLVAMAQPDCPEPYCPPVTAFVYGQSGWYSTGDLIQFVGDSNVNVMPDGGCGSHDWIWGNCLIDNGFTFRKVTNFNSQSCTYTAADTCDVVRAPCCFFFPPPCGTCTSCCGSCELCKSIWEVVDYHADGSTGRGCWEIEFVSDCAGDSEDCEDGLEMCDTSRTWFE